MNADTITRNSQWLKILLLLMLNNFTFSQWFQQNSGTTGDLKSVYFVNPLTGWVCGVTGTQSTDRIAKTTDGGSTWVKQNAGTFYVLNSIQFINDQTGWAAGLHGTVVKTTNGGTNWISIFGTTSWDWDKVQFVNLQTGWAAGVQLSGIYQTTDGGLNWNFFSNENSFRDFQFVNSLTGFGLSIVGNARISKTTNSGGNWTYTQYENTYFDALYFVDTLNGWIVGDPSKMAHSSNGGLTWDTTRITNNLIGPRAIVFLDLNTGYLAGVGGILYKTTNSGFNWIAQNSGVSVNLNSVYFVDNQTGWVAGQSGKILKTTNGGGPVGIVQTSSEIPASFSLGQNYPNPFNPVTKISFKITERTNVKIRVLDILGKEIDVLVNQLVNPGSFEIVWNAAQSPSGVYFYRLETDYFTETKKMILLK